MLTMDQKKAYITLLSDAQNDIDITLHMHTSRLTPSQVVNQRLDRTLNIMKDLTAILKTVVAALE